MLLGTRRKQASCHAGLAAKSWMYVHGCVLLDWDLDLAKPCQRGGRTQVAHWAQVGRVTQRKQPRPGTARTHTKTN